MNQENINEKKQRDRVHRAALLEVETDEIACELAELDAELEKKKDRKIDAQDQHWLNMPLSARRMIVERLERKKITIIENLAETKKELENLLEEIAANGGPATVTKAELEIEKNEAIAWFIEGGGTRNGLPGQNRSMRESLMKELETLLEQHNNQLIVAPSQSGKSALALLFLTHLIRQRASLAAPNGNVLFMSFPTSDIPRNASSFGSRIKNHTASLNKHFPNVFPIRGWTSFVDFVNTSGNVLIIDSCQTMFECDFFWELFNTSSQRCKVLALSSCAFPAHHGEWGRSAPTNFKVNPYHIMAFNETEFDEVFRQFQAKKPAKFGEEVYKLVKLSVSFNHGERQQMEASLRNLAEPRLYHPGLTYASLYEISKFAVTTEEGVLAALEQKNLYPILLKQHYRCFAPLRAAENWFYSKVKPNFNKQWQNRTPKLIDANIAEGLAQFTNKFRHLVFQLLKQGFLVFDLNDPVEMAYKESLVNNTFCYEDFSSQLPGTVRQSCELMRQHLAFKMAYEFQTRL